MPSRSIKQRAISDSGVASGKVRRSVTVNEVESPLGWLHKHGHLTIRQYDAGEQLRSDWEGANLAPRVTMRWDPAPVSRSGAPGEQLEPSERQVTARSRFDAAMAASGPGMTDILWRIVCAGEGMREAETALGWPARAGKLVLRMALDRVADFYRLPGS